MSTPTSTLPRIPIVIALDGSEYSEIVLEHGLDQAARQDLPDLHVVTVVGASSELEPTERWLSQLVADALDAFGRRPTWRTRIHVRCGKPEDEIANLAADVEASLIVLGRYGVHRRRDSVAHRLIELTSCPTLIVGLSGRPVEAQPQCRACMRARDESDGTRWFCDAHVAPGRVRLSTLVPQSTSDPHGGLW